MFSINTTAQNYPQDSLAEFVYGNHELDSFVLDNLVRPDECLKYGIDFNIDLSFVVDTLGAVAYVNIIYTEPTFKKWSEKFLEKIDSLKPYVEQEVIRVIKSTSGFWFPSEINGKKEKQIFHYKILLRTPEFYTKGGNFRNTGMDGVNAPYYIPFDVPYTNPIKYYNLGVKKLTQKKYFIAIKYFQHSIELGNQSVDVYYNLGSALLLNNQKVEACEAWKKALELGDDEVKELIEKYCVKKDGKW